MYGYLCALLLFIIAEADHNGVNWFVCLLVLVLVRISPGVRNILEIIFSLRCCDSYKIRAYLH